MSDTLTNYPPLLADFLDAFGSDRTAVAREIKAIWEKAGQFNSPVEVYEALIDARVAGQNISAERGDFLKKYFASSFQPEATTLYFNKHREPLIDALACLYREQFPNRPFYYLEGDLINLGGLNKAIPNEEQADSVFRTICAIVADSLHQDGKNGVLAIRKGGDELGYYVTPANESHVDEIKNSITNAYSRVAAFISDAGLAEIAHKKTEQPPGVGIGLASINLNEGATALQAGLIKIRLDEGKIAYRESLKQASHARAGNLPKIIHIEAAIEKHFPQLEAKLEKPYLTSTSGSLFLTPDATRQRQIINHLGSAVPKGLSYADFRLGTKGAEAINKLEQRLLLQTCLLTAPRDFVTNLPLFGNMQGMQLPCFRYQQGKNGVHLAHIDFSNMAAGNKISPAIGDAMGKRYAEVVQSALADIGHADLMPYLASKGGGKFALLLPADMPDATWQQFNDVLANRLNEASKTPLDLTKSALFMAQMIIRGHPELNQYYRDKIEGIVDNGISMEWLVSPTTRLAGTQIATARTTNSIDVKEPLGDTMRPLEAETNRKQQINIEKRRPDFRIRTSRAQLMGTASAPALLSGASQSI